MPKKKKKKKKKKEEERTKSRHYVKQPYWTLHMFFGKFQFRSTNIQQGITLHVG